MYDNSDKIDEDNGEELGTEGENGFEINYALIAAVVGFLGLAACFIMLLVSIWAWDIRWTLTAVVIGAASAIAIVVAIADEY